MKNSLLAIVMLLIGALMPAGMALALARAPFPDATKLQPLPAIAHPDVSGNVQRTPLGTKPSGTVPQEQHFSESVAVQAQEVPADEASSTSAAPMPLRYGFLVVLMSMALVFVGLIVWFVRAF